MFQSSSVYISLLINNTSSSVLSGLNIFISLIAKSYFENYPCVKRKNHPIIY